jgi:hypothetical protein
MSVEVAFLEGRSKSFYFQALGWNGPRLKTWIAYDRPAGAGLLRY